ncbi:GNAT family N-acetyltransferase [Cryobacterium sp. TMT1-66-1]|uniref:GNAT family N-acetyltransferase n=1 Tax=Cryobacterium sp. TMT1-66-1 TaxID=1259242 RepID=UPI00141B5402
MISSERSDIEIRTYPDLANLPRVEVIEELYASASRLPPLSEAPEVAHSFARLYGYARQRNDVVGVGVLVSGNLVGFAYGHPWSWESETDVWSQQLRHRLGPDSAALIDESFAVLLLAVHPAAGRRGLGAVLLESLMNGSNAQTHWLQTTDFETPALRLYLRMRYRSLGHGPDAPNGKPGLVLIHTRNDAR